MKILTKASVLVTTLSLVFASLVNATACPFCSAPSLTLSEQATQSDVVLLASWKEGIKGTIEGDGSEASTTFEVTKVLKGDFKPGQEIKQVGYQPAEKGEFFLLTGIGTDVVQWDIPTPFSEKAFEYLAKAPAAQTADGEKVSYDKRLPYFIKYLESPDETIANDAYGEFANAPYEEIVKVKEHLDRKKLRAWVLDENTAPSRLGLYGLLLGLSGTDEDAQAMETMIAKPTDEFRIGLDGIMSGYLMLKKQPGLDLVRELKLENEFIVDKSGKTVTDAQGEKIPVPFSETYAAMQAVRFMWDYGAGVIAPEQLQAAMRVLLDRPELADLAIADLARWKDWSIAKRLFDLYDAEAYQVPGIKRAIIRYFDAAKKDIPKDAAESAEPPKHVKQAEEYYAEIKKKDPETVKSVEQFLILVQ